MNDAVYFLSEGWKKVGVRENDILLVHSSLKRTFRRLKENSISATADDILDSFLSALGPGGTFILPMFNMGFCSGKPFDIRETPSHMGLLTETARRRDDTVRTGHPIFSYGVLGARRNEFQGLANHGAYDEHSPLAFLRRHGGKIGVLDVSDKCMTFYHHVEEMLDVPYRYHKEFSGQYTDEHGMTDYRTFDFHVRSLKQKVISTLEPMQELMWEEGVYEGDRPGIETGLRVADANKLFRVTSDIIQAGRAKGMLYNVQTTSVDE